MYREQAVEIIERHIDNNIASGSLVEQAFRMAIDALKAQLSQQGTTSDQPVATDTNVGDTISRQWLMECVNEGWIKFDTEKDENRFIHLVRDIAPSVQPETHEERTETHACDLISRQATIDALNHMCSEDENEITVSRANVNSMLKSLPSVQPETAKRIVGKSRDGMTLWYQCDMCNEPVDEQDNYCRGCGRRLIDG